MSTENAKVFVEKLYGDDEFIKEFYRNGGINKKVSKEEKKCINV